MTDQSAAIALRSDAALVVIEAPAGCGKTYQAAEYARWLGDKVPVMRTLILTHTHAACDVFRERTSGQAGRTQVSTFDGFITQLATIYHQSLGLPRDVARWAFEANDGFELLAERVGELLAHSHAIRSAIVARYPVIICDEHQDTNPAQHGVAMKLLAAGAKLRVFADPQQAIFVKAERARAVHRVRWQDFVAGAEHNDALDVPHRWRNGAMQLGEWTLAARRALRAGEALDLRGDLPAGLRVVRASNVGFRNQFRLDSNAQQVREIVRRSESLLVLAPTRELVASIHAFFGRTIPIWEGHVRPALNALVYACAAHSGDASAVAASMCDFIQSAITGFTDQLRTQCLSEVAAGAVARRRGIPAEVQSIARCVLDAPDHRGVARALQRLTSAAAGNGVLRELSVNHFRELREAARLDQFDDPIEGQAELTRRRTHSPAAMPSRVISTVHKAKGLERRDVVLMPCDRGTFAGTDYKRCLMYVALSRATHSLTLVVNPVGSSPLFRL